MKKIIFGLVVFLVCAASAAAQTLPTGRQATSSTPSPSASPSATPNFREQIKNSRLVQMKTLNASTTRQINQKREDLKAQIQANFLKLKETIAAKREALKTKIAEQKKLLQDKLKQIKDQVKQNRVLRISDRLTALNNLMVDNFLAVLTRLDSISNNIVSRTDKAQSAGLDVTAVRTAISDAQKAISVSREKVQAQAGKTYPVTITTEDKLRMDVEKVRQTLHADLVAVRATVIGARDAVRKAAATLAQINGIDEINSNPSASPSPSVSPSPSASASANPSPSPSDND